MSYTDKQIRFIQALTATQFIDVFNKLLREKKVAIADLNTWRSIWLKREKEPLIQVAQQVFFTTPDKGSIDKL